MDQPRHLLHAAVGVVRAGFVWRRSGIADPRLNAFACNESLGGAYVSRAPDFLTLPLVRPDASWGVAGLRYDYRAPAGQTAYPD